MGKKPIVSVTYENERISIKNSLPYLKCVLRLSCVVHVQFDALTVVDFTMLYWFGSHFSVGVRHRLLLSSRVSSLVINLLTI